MLKKQREDYEIALRSIDQMTRQLDAAMLVNTNKFFTVILLRPLGW